MRSKTLAAVLACGAACGLASRAFGPSTEPMPRPTDAIQQLTDPSAGDRLRRATERRAQEHTGQVVAGVIAVTFAVGYVVTRRAADMNMQA